MVKRRLLREYSNKVAVLKHILNAILCLMTCLHTRFSTDYGTIENNLKNTQPVLHAHQSCLGVNSSGDL